MAVGQNGTLAMSYVGSLNPAHSGIYRSDVFNAATDDLPLDDSVLLVTQLEQTGARHLFPCVDEPESKVSIPPVLQALTTAIRCHLLAASE